MRRFFSPFAILWLGLGVGLNFIEQDTIAAVAVSVAGIAHSSVGFITHGGRRISAPGVYMLGTGLFGYYSTLYLIVNPVFGPLPYLLAAVNILFFGQVLNYYLSWKPRDRDTPPQCDDVDPRIASWGKWLGLFVAAAGVVLSARGFTEPPLAEAAAFVGIILYGVAAFRDPSRNGLVSYLIFGAAVLAYMTYVFTGFGRLNLGALGIAVVTTVAQRWRGRLMKIGLIVILGPALMYLAQNRANFAASLNPSGQKETGLESVVGPMMRFSQLIGMEWAGNLPHTWGSSFSTSAVALVPRAIWPDKPIGFGAELATLFAPELAGTGHSEAALFAGEWLFNFGIIGVLASIPLIGFAVNWLDTKWTAAEALPMTERRHLLKAVALTILSAGLLDLVWGGSFTYASREGSRLLIILILFAVLALDKRAREKKLRPALPLPP
ncbi:hypothetical protein QFZ36_001522 [Pseudarthrobacter siccitolerans]|uniref:O-Antigen Polymerase family protein n=1 Tax=Pseudarthrobacter siccitolerans TaxID=861266 RepID=A0ABU0PJ26_9MICC|nr:hypothetical protein [Pseudarthrobacter siccitolerans]MDQ0673961.1 hypothetical protein [Pseudarthrobacter siccitolerans]